MVVATFSLGARGILNGTHRAAMNTTEAHGARTMPLRSAIGECYVVHRAHLFT